MGDYEANTRNTVVESTNINSANTANSNGSCSCRHRCEKYFAELDRWEIWRSILLGQMLSLLLCGTGVLSQILSSNYKVNAPTAQSFLNYVLLCLVFTTMLACRGGETSLIPILRDRGWKYFFLALADVEANYLVVKAYQYTTLTSVQLLDCFTIPVVLLLSWIVLKVRYKIVHILGVSICLMGIGCLVWADADDSKESGIVKNRLLGDLLCMTGAFLYGVSNVAEEFVVKTFDMVEFLGMLGLFGSVINGVQLASLEHEEVASIDWSDWHVIVLLLAFAAVLFAYYVGVPIVLKFTSATAVNLSLLTSDFYSLIFGVVMFHFQYHALYALSFFLVISGVVIFCAKSAPVRSQQEAALYRTMLTRTTTVTTAASSSHDLHLSQGTNTSTSSTPSSTHYHFLYPPPPPPPQVTCQGSCTMTHSQSLPLPVYAHSAEMAYGTYRRQPKGGHHQHQQQQQQQQQMTSFVGGAERALLGGRERSLSTSSQVGISTQTVTVKFPPSSPSDGGPEISSRGMGGFSTLPRPRGHKEVTFNPQATFQVYRRSSVTYDGDEQL